MANNNNSDRLLALLNYWLEHNHEHGHEYEGWVKRIKDMGYSNIAEEVLEAVGLTEKIQHHFLKARDLLTSGEAGGEQQKYHEHGEVHKNRHHEHVTLHVIGNIHTPYSGILPEQASEKDGEFFLEIYFPYSSKIADLKPGMQISIIYILIKSEKESASAHDHADHDEHHHQLQLNPVDIATATITEIQHEKVEITPVLILDGAKILSLK